MDKNFKFKRKLIYTIISILFFSLLGCPRPPPIPFVFTESHKKNNYEVKLLNDKLTLMVVCSGKLSKHSKRYSMSFGLNIDHSKLEETLRFNFDNIEIYLNNNALSKVEVQGGNSFYLRKTKDSYSNGSNFYINLNIEQFEHLTHKKHDITIVLDKFIVMNDDYLFIDTINAYDPTIIIE